MFNNVFIKNLKLIPEVTKVAQMGNGMYTIKSIVYNKSDKIFYFNATSLRVSNPFYVALNPKQYFFNVQ